MKHIPLRLIEILNCSLRILPSRALSEYTTGSFWWCSKYSGRKYHRLPQISQIFRLWYTTLIFPFDFLSSLVSYLSSLVFCTTLLLWTLWCYCYWVVPSSHKFSYFIFISVSIFFVDCFSLVSRFSWFCACRFHFTHVLYHLLYSFLYIYARSWFSSYSFPRRLITSLILSKSTIKTSFD